MHRLGVLVVLVGAVLCAVFLWNTPGEHDDLDNIGSAPVGESEFEPRRKPSDHRNGTKEPPTNQTEAREPEKDRPTPPSAVDRILLEALGNVRYGVLEKHKVLGQPDVALRLTLESIERVMDLEEHRQRLPAFRAGARKSVERACLQYEGDETSLTLKVEGDLTTAQIRMKHASVWCRWQLPTDGSLPHVIDLRIEYFAAGAQYDGIRLAFNRQRTPTAFEVRPFEFRKSATHPNGRYHGPYPKGLEFESVSVSVEEVKKMITLAGLRNRTVREWKAASSR